jgi:hypothetical protein
MYITRCHTVNSIKHAVFSLSAIVFTQLQGFTLCAFVFRMCGYANGIKSIMYVCMYASYLHNNVTYWVSLVVLHMRSNNVNVAATINSASCYSSVVTQQ